MSDDLNFGEIEILEDDFCMKSYDYNTYSRENMICAGYKNVSNKIHIKCCQLGLNYGQIQSRIPTVFQNLEYIHRFTSLQ